MSYESIDAQIEELALYCANFSGFHWNSTAKGLCKAWLKYGKGDPAEGWQYLRAHAYVMRNLINPAAKDYKRCHGSMTQKWTDMWPLNIRQACCSHVIDMLLDDFELGNLYE
jgi:hypothetical protein